MLPATAGAWDRTTCTEKPEMGHLGQWMQYNLLSRMKPGNGLRVRATGKSGNGPGTRFMNHSLLLTDLECVQ